MKITKEEREALQDELKELTTPGLKSLDDLKHVEERGAEILRLLIDDDILTRVIALGDQED